MDFHKVNKFTKRKTLNDPYNTFVYKRNKTSNLSVKYLIAEASRNPLITAITETNTKPF